MKIRIDSLRPIRIARLADAEVDHVIFDISPWREAYPALTNYRVEVTSPGGIVYFPVKVALDGSDLVWTIAAEDTASAGDGLYQIVATGMNDERKTSASARFVVREIMEGTAGETPPDPAQPWVDEVVRAAQKVEDATVHPPIIGANGNWLLWDFDASAYVDSGKPSQGSGSGGGGIAQETDPTVPAWAKRPDPPAYTAQDVGARPADWLPTPKEIGAQPAGDYALKSEIPAVPVRSVNGKTGAVELTADDVNAASKEAVDRLSEEIAPLKETLSQFPSIPTATSANLYNPALQTDDTISPHYYVNGAPYSTTQFDGSYNCTAPIDIEGGKTYSIAIVPAFTLDGVERTVPWGKAEECVFFYDADGNYLSKSGNRNTFTTPDNAKTIRFNYCTKSMALGLAALNNKCVLVEGSTVPTTYIPYVESGYITYADLVPQIPARIYYAIAGNSIQVVTKYNAEYDLVTKLGEQVGNGLFDFKGFGLIANTGAYVSNQPDAAATLQTIGTDSHAPFQVVADANADGDNLNGDSFRQNFTGGAHQYNNESSGSTATARLVSVEFITDGVIKTDGSGYCNQIEMRWTNHVQGYNTTKADGTGREIMKENHRLVFDGHVWKSYVELVALEAITIKLWYGFQLSNLSGAVRYVGGANRGAYATTEASNCGNNTAVRLINEDTDKAHRFEMSLNRAVDLGGGSENKNTPNNGLFASRYGKSYFRVIDGAFALADGETAYIEGEYRFASS